MENEDRQIFANYLARLSNDLQMVKAQNAVLIELISKQLGLSIEEIGKEVESKHADMAIKEMKVWENVISDAHRQSRKETPPSDH